MAFNAAYCLLRLAWNSVPMAANILVVDDDPLNRDLIVKCYAKRVTRSSRRAMKP